MDRAAIALAREAMRAIVHALERDDLAVIDDEPLAEDIPDHLSTVHVLHQRPLRSTPMPMTNSHAHFERGS